ncbi:MAG: glycerol acyltransferase [Actinomycetia bacterium]|nr:glycerol acyltransferase [Actinomycetes bacterium]
MARDFGFDADRTGGVEALPKALRRRISGHYPVDPFGLDPQLCDLVAPAFGVFVRVRVDHPERIPATGPAALVSNRGLGVGEPAALGVAMRQYAQRRLRVVGAPIVPVLGAVSRRLGAVSSSAEDLGSALAAGHLVAVPLTPTWLRAGAGLPPLALVQAMMPYPVLPVSVRPGGPFHTPIVWDVRIGLPITLGRTYTPGDPLGAAELGEAVRAAVGGLLAGDEADEIAPSSTALHDW